MTVLYDPLREIVFSDQPCAPLGFATYDAADLFAEREALIAGIAAVHHNVDGTCAEDALRWPCTTARLVRAATKGAV